MTGRTMRYVLVPAVTLAATASLAVPAQGRAANPYERGPAPTEASVTAQRGPFAVSQQTLDGIGYDHGTVYYPTTTSAGTFGAVVVTPGFTNGQRAVAHYGPRIASQGFVVMTLQTHSVYDRPDSRATQMLAALDHLVHRSALRSRIDPARLALIGYSMGGGGVLRAAERRPSLRAAIALAPWSRDRTWPDNRPPALVITADGDTVAPSDGMGETFYNSMIRVPDKAFLELGNADHRVPLTDDTRIFTYSISWLKRFVDDDTRYSRFLCPGPATGTSAVSRYQATCPMD
ncbi:MAG TPA: alpha/beta hydrolase [Thermomonospora sp.]|nr:alpha/beta hydrolase [Thermomonospora sp.]